MKVKTPADVQRSAKELREQGNSLFKSQNYTAAEEIYSHALAVQPNVESFNNSF